MFSKHYLEKKFGVNYDASSAAWLDADDFSRLSVEKQDALKTMRPQNHHFLSLAHSPDLIGLVFSILDQFTGEASFIASSEFIRVKPKLKKHEIDQFELRGSNTISKIFCGFVNWVGHCLSDTAGSNTTRADSNKRGSGLPIPGFEFFQFISITPGRQKNITKDLAELSVKVFENGYDARFGLALSVPVVISELLTRLSFALKRYFYHHLPVNECIPVNFKVGSHPHQPELRRMLLVSHGVGTLAMQPFSMRLQVVMCWQRLSISTILHILVLLKTGWLNCGQDIAKTILTLMPSQNELKESGRLSAQTRKNGYRQN